MYARVVKIPGMKEWTKTYLVYNQSLFRRLRQMASIKKMLNFYSFPVSLGQVYFVLIFDLNQSQGTKPISRNGHGPDCFVHGISPFFAATLSSLKRASQVFSPTHP